jgi:arylsulfatase A
MQDQIKLLLGTFGAGVLLFSCNSTNKVNKEQRAGKPNIIFILADDLGYGDVGFMGQKRFTTPNLDKMAAGGLVFTNHYSGSTVCAPSRCALMTGLHTGHTYIRGNREHRPEGQEPLLSGIETVAELLQQAGYITGAFGKWGLGYPGSEGEPNNQGFNEFFGYNCQRLAHNYYPYHLWHNRDTVLLTANREKSTGEYAPAMIHRQALKFIDDNKNRPFFLYYPTTIPHAELVAPDEEIQKFKGKLLPEKSYEGYDDGSEFRQGPYGSQKNCHAAFAAMITTLDEQIGEILAKLESLGIAENTLVIFTSDNGPHKEGGADPDYFDSNGILRGFKRDLYEGGIRVPMVAWWPGKIHTGTTGHLSAFWDFLPTCCDLAGIQNLRTTDGISYLPTLLGKTKEQKQHEYLYWEFHEGGTAQAIRMGKWKGVKNKTNLPVELYDLSSDEGETTNRADTNPETVKNLDHLFLTARTESSLWPKQ